jgi:polyisoprenoid-binding protein YceI
MSPLVAALVATKLLSCLAAKTGALELTLTSFKCRVNPMDKKQMCGADARAKIKRPGFWHDLFPASYG